MLSWFFMFLVDLLCSLCIWRSIYLSQSPWTDFHRHFHFSAVLVVSHSKAGDKTPFASFHPSWRKNINSLLPLNHEKKMMAIRICSPLYFVFNRIRAPSSSGCSVLSIRQDRNQLHRRHYERPWGPVHTLISPSIHERIMSWVKLLGAELSLFGGGTDVRQLKLLFLPI